MPCLFRLGLQSYGTWAGIMEIVQTNGSEFDQWGVSEQIWMNIYELDLIGIEAWPYEKNNFNTTEKIGKLKKYF